MSIDPTLAPPPPPAPASRQPLTSEERARLDRNVLVERVYARASEVIVCAGPMGGRGILLIQQHALGKPYGWVVQYQTEGNGGRVPRLLVNWDGMVEWDRHYDDHTPEFRRQTRFSLEDALTLCDSLDLWSCRWVQGQGYVNRAGTWVGLNMYVDRRVPGFDDAAD